nr:EOG090X0JCO [Sida crystallina]
MAGTLRNVFQFISNRNVLKLSSNRAYLSAFQSNYSLEKVYPQSKLDITTIPKPPKQENGKFSGYIPLDQIQINYSRSSGPGGQNVNCVDTKAEVRFHLATADWIPEKIRSKLSEQLKNLVTKEGFIVIKSDRTRSQQLNLSDALDKLRNMIHQAGESLVTKQPSPATLEKHRRLSERAARERLKEKRIHSVIKQGRQAPSLD